jgi:hypothetical protein
VGGDGDGDRTVWVFVELSDPHTARIYFRGPQGQRFLLRELALQGGLDEFGLELIGEVVESSVEALLHSSAGLSRDQARVALADRARLAEGRREPAPRAAPLAGDTPRFAGWLGLRYAAQWWGSDLGAADGPGAEIGLEWRGPALFRATFGVERWLDRTFVSSEVRALIQSWPLRLSVDVGIPAGREQVWLVGLGAGFDVTRVEPGPSVDPSVTPAAAQTHVVPVGRVELRYEISAGSFRLSLAAFADVSMLQTHYDVERGANAERLAVTWPLRPGAALVFAWRPTWN